MAAAGIPQFASLYVGDLHPDVTEAMLYEIFNSVGPVASIRVCRDSISRRSLGYGYVNFHGVSDAERALDTLNYSSIKGRACRIMWSQRDPSLRKSGVGNVFVKNLDRNIDNKALYDTFSLFGNILSCKVATDQQAKSRGYGFVHYETEEAARQAVERVNGMQIGDKTVHVTGFQKRGDREKPEITEYTNLYIKNMPDDWDEEKLKSVFGKFGTLNSICIMKDKKDRQFAFINYSEKEEAHAAVREMHKADVGNPKPEKEDDVVEDGCPSHLLYCQRAQKKSERHQELREKFPQPDKTSPARAQGVNLYIKNLDEATDDSALRALFEPFGNITSCVATMDEKQRCKGFGFVCFASPDEATKAVTEMHLKVVKGKPLYVGLAEKREARQDRLRQRYSSGGATGGPMGGGPMGGMGGMMGPMGGKGMMGAGGPKGKGKDGKGGPQQQGMYEGGGMQGGMPQQMMGGKGPMPQMMGPMGMMYPGMGGKGPMMGPMGMMGGAPQMMGGKGPMPQMMGPMGGKPGMGPMGGMPGMGGKPGVGPMGPMGMPGGGMGPMGGKGMPGMPGSMPGMMGGMPGKGGLPPQQQQPQQPMMRPPQQQQQPAQQPPQPGQPQQPQQPGGPLTAAALAAAPPAIQKQMIGEKLYPAIARFQPELAGKITGMMLEMDNSELLILLESDQQLRIKVDEALRVLETTRA